MESGCGRVPRAKGVRSPLPKRPISPKLITARGAHARAPGLAPRQSPRFTWTPGARSPEPPRPREFLDPSCKRHRGMDLVVAGTPGTAGANGTPDPQEQCRPEPPATPGPPRKRPGCNELAEASV